MEVPYINWMQKFSVYETSSHIYVVGSDIREQSFRILKISRSPVPLNEEILNTDNEYIDSQPTIEDESPIDRVWRLSIVEDPHTYTKSELARLLHTVQAASRNLSSVNKNFSITKNNDKSTISSSSNKWSRLGELFGKRHLNNQKPVKLYDSLVSGINDSPSVIDNSRRVCNNPKELQQAAASALYSGSSERSLVLSAKCYGIVGVVRFLRGYYLILITKCSVVAVLGEHRIYKVEDTAMLYIPGNQFIEDNGLQSGESKGNLPTSSSSTMGFLLEEDDSGVYSTISSNDNSQQQQQSSIFQFLRTTVGRNKLQTDEMRYVKLFGNVDLASNFYFSYTYDLSHTMQYNMEPVFPTNPPKPGQVWAIRSIPNDRFVWNWRLVPLHFRPNASVNDSNQNPEWFTLLYHGSISQTALSACSMPLMITLIARRSRYFAGCRFLKRGTNFNGDVANEVETEQIVHDTSYSFLRHGRVSSYVLMRGSVPLFWSQESSKVVVGRPPLEFLREDPYFESMGLHLSNIFERFGSPIIILNLMKRREKRRFETALSDGFERGLIYLNQFLPSKITRKSNQIELQPIDFIPTSPPLIYIGFDIARVQKFKNMVALDQLTPIVDSCVRRTGIYFNTLSSSPILANQNFLKCKTIGFNSKQCGLIRVNCVDCLDRTNTSQFVIGRIVLAYQLYGLGFLDKPIIINDSRIDRLLQDLYDEHGDTLALQYGGSQLVHNIDTYRKTHKLTSQSRDFVQTISRLYKQDSFSESLRKYMTSAQQSCRSGLSIAMKLINSEHTLVHVNILK